MNYKSLAGLTIASALLLGACGEETKTEEKKTTAEKPTTEAPTTEKPTTEKPEVKAEENTLYGKLTDKDAKINGGIAINKKRSVTYLLGDNKKILQVEKDFDTLPLNKELDHELIKEHTKDYMNDDVEITNDEENSKTYHSKKLDKDYYVTYSLNEKGEIVRIIVSSFK